MALNIKDAETERLARDLARLTGETVADATRKALEERMSRVGGERRRERLLEDLAAIRRRWKEMAVRDARSADELVGYDEHGRPR